MVVDAKRRGRGAVIVATQNVRDAGGLQIAMERRRQPKGQQHQGGEAADVSHEITERRNACVVNATRYDFAVQPRAAVPL
jgi:hypothetical protein